MMRFFRLCSSDPCSEHRTGSARRVCGIALLMGCMLLFVGCRVERPKEILNPSQMGDVLYDFHLAQIMGADLNGDDMYKRSLYLEYVYDKHHITQEQLDSSLIWYARNPKNLAAIYENLGHRADVEMERIKRMQEEAELRGPKPVEGDSADIWYDHRLMILTSSPLSNRVSYAIPTDSNFHLCDILEWTFDIRFFPRNTIWENVLDEMAVALAESTAPDSLAIDSLAADSLVVDSLPTDLLLTDSLLLDSLRSSLVGNPLTSDSIVVDSLMADSLVVDSIDCAQSKLNKPQHRATTIATLVLHYANDSIVAVDRVLADDASVRITLQNTDSVRLNDVNVYIYFKSHDKADRVILYNNSLTRYRYVAPPKTVMPDSLSTAMPDSVALDSLSIDSTTHSALADTLPEFTVVETDK